jgi:hypothetical protein
MSRGEGAAGTGLQVLLEIERAARVAEGDDHDHFPRAAVPGVSGVPPIVMRESRLHVGRQPGVVAIGLFLAANHVDEALGCRDAARLSKGAAVWFRGRPPSRWLRRSLRGTSFDVGESLCREKPDREACGLACHPKLAEGERRMVSLNFASWNQLDGWLRRVDGLRRAA